MADILSKSDRSKLMSRIRNADTGPEMLVRSMLHSRGFRFRLHRKDLPGRPDIVLPRYRVAVLVHGCFWHLHDNCPDGRLPKSNIEFWKKKLYGNKERDKRNLGALAEAEWRPIVVWECEIEKDLEAVGDILESQILRRTR